MAISVVQLRLFPSPGQETALSDTMRRCNSAATYAAKVAWTSKVFRRFSLHKLVYKELRKEYGLAAQAAVHVIGRVAATYANRSSSKKRAHVFRPLGAISYDDRILSFNRGARTVSIWTLEGRQTIPYAGRSEDLVALEKLPVGECDLAFVRGKWLLKCCVTLPDVPVKEPLNGFLGVDLGITLLAVICDGQVLPGPALAGTVRSNGHLRSIRERRHRQRVRMERKGTPSARRRLRTLAGREARFVKDVDHQISKSVVREAERTGRGIAFEDLRGIQGQVRVNRSQRRTVHSWSYGRLTDFTEYKAARRGVPFITVDPAHTSQTCPGCGHVDRRNRLRRDRFCCVRCGFAGPADLIAALNIARRGAECWAVVNEPYAA